MLRSGEGTLQVPSGSVLFPAVPCARLEHGAIPVPKAARKALQGCHLTLPWAEAQAHSDGH